MRKLIIVVLSVFVLLIGAGGFFLSKGKTLEERHADYDEADFDYANGSFADYIAYSRARLTAARIDNTDNATIANMLPFELAPPSSCNSAANGKAEQGVLLIHGLLETAYSMRELGEFLQSQCFYVLGLLLPDHGSRPGDFLSTDWKEWVASTRFAVRALGEKADTIIAGGHSAGGALALLDASQNPDVDALLLFAPALAITDAAKYARFVVPFGLLFPKAAWVQLEADEAIYRYESLSFTAASETYALTQALLAADQTRLQQLPILTVASMEDTTVSTPIILEFMARNTNEKSVTLLYSQHPLADVGNELILPAADKLKVIPSATPAQGILSVSHLGLMIPPTNPYFGKDGAYRNCGHYGSATNPEFVRCKNGERSWYGEATGENRQQGTLERIAFNPYYNAMLAEVLRFLK